MQNGIQIVKPVQQAVIDWPVELQLSQDIDLFNAVLDALGPECKSVSMHD